MSNVQYPVPIEILRERSQDNWLVNYDHEKLLRLTEEFLAEYSYSQPQKIILSESDPAILLARFIAAVSSNNYVFLGNPTWGSLEWQQALSLVETELNTDKNLPQSLIMIPTGGSSGKIRFAIHTWQTLTSSVTGFCQYFLLKEVNSFCVLPLYHVSGLMQFIRSFISGGKLVITPFRELKTDQWCDFPPEDFFISLVPTQLQALLSQEKFIPWLAKFKTVLLGGAPSWSDLIQTAKQHNIPLSPCYGMTETASQVVTLKPEKFLQGDISNGQNLPHARIKILDEQGKELAANQTGKITITAASLALGYYPELFPNKTPFCTDDLGYLDERGNLHLMGRHSDKIITGGENVFPLEVEAAIRSTNLVADVAVLGREDVYWGQIICAVYIPNYSSVEHQQIKVALEGKIAKYKQPKIWFKVNSLPRNAQGKVNKSKLKEILTTSRKSN